MSEPKIKVVHVISRFNVGGTATWLSTLVNQFSKENHISFILAGNVAESEREDLRFLERNGIRIRTLKKDLSPFKDFLAFLQIRKIIKHLSPDVVNTHTSKAGALGRIAAWSLGRNRPALVHTYHGHLLEGYFSRPKVFLVLLIEKMLESCSDLLLFAGEKVRFDLRRKGIGTRRPTQLVRPGVEVLNPRSMTSRVRQNRFTVGWLGRFESVKRPDLAIELSKLMPNLNFRIGGSGSLYDSQSRCAGENVKLMGWVESKSFWSECDVAILTSENEAMPLSLLEAGSIGIPVVTLQAGSAPEVVVEGETGFVVEDLMAMKTAIEKLENDVDLYLRMSNASIQFIDKYFSPERMYEDHHRAYLEAIYRRSKA